MRYFFANIEETTFFSYDYQTDTLITLVEEPCGFGELIRTGKGCTNLALQFQHEQKHLPEHKRLYKPISKEQYTSVYAKYQERRNEIYFQTI